MNIVIYNFKHIYFITSVVIIILNNVCFVSHSQFQFCLVNSQTNIFFISLKIADREHSAFLITLLEYEFDSIFAKRVVVKCVFVHTLANITLYLTPALISLLRPKTMAQLKAAQEHRKNYSALAVLCIIGVYVHAFSRASLTHLAPN